MACGRCQVRGMRGYRGFGTGASPPGAIEQQCMTQCDDGSYLPDGTSAYSSCLATCLAANAGTTGTPVSIDPIVTDDSSTTWLLIALAVGAIIYSQS